MGGVRGREFYNITGRTQFFPQHKFELKKKIKKITIGEEKWRTGENGGHFKTICCCFFPRVVVVF
jgi:hypothetical protein